MLFIWQQTDWPEFRYDLGGMTDQLLRMADQTGRVSGMLEGLPERLGTEAVLDLMLTEALQSSAIEGENLDRDGVMSSLRNHLGLSPEPEPVDSRMAEGAGELMVAVRQGFQEPLTADMLFSWHRMLLDGTCGIHVGGWREKGDPMQVVSGRIDRPTVHYEAPPAKDVPAEMSRFISWFNHTAPGRPGAIPHAPVRSALAHLYFESIHPFDDGNGRLGRALSEKALAQGLGRPVVLSLSGAIETERHDYYDALKRAQRSTEVTPWIQWFVGLVERAQHQAGERIGFVLAKEKFFRRFEDQLNPRQLKVVRRMFEAGPGGFVGGMNARKYVALTGASKATATRDLQQLIQLGAVTSLGGGRSTRYELVRE